MAIVSETTDPRTGATFTLDRLELKGDVLIVSGRWADVREVRFTRPELLTSDGERTRALPAHRPWTPRGAQRWTVKFPWEADPEGLRGARISVGEGIVVPVVGDDGPVPTREPADDEGPAGKKKPAAKKPAAKKAAGAKKTTGTTKRKAAALPEEASTAQLRRRIRRLEGELDTLREERDAAVEAAETLRQQLHAAQEEVQRRPPPQERSAGWTGDEDEEAIGMRMKPRTVLPGDDLERMPAPPMRSRLSESDLVAIRLGATLAALVGFVLLIVLLGILF